MERVLNATHEYLRDIGSAVAPERYNTDLMRYIPVLNARPQRSEACAGSSSAPSPYSSSSSTPDELMVSSVDAVPRRDRRFLLLELVRRELPTREPMRELRRLRTPVAVNTRAEGIRAGLSGGMPNSEGGSKTWV